MGSLSFVSDELWGKEVADFMKIQKSYRKWRIKLMNFMNLVNLVNFIKLMNSSNLEISIETVHLVNKASAVLSCNPR